MAWEPYALCGQPPSVMPLTLMCLFLVIVQNSVSNAYLENIHPVSIHWSSILYWFWLPTAAVTKDPQHRCVI